MPTPIEQSKAALRERVRAQVQAISPAGRAALSAQARALLETKPIWANAESILFFAPLATELDVWPLLTAALANGKTVGLPQFDSETNCYRACQVRNISTDIQPGRFGIREPSEGCSGFLLKRLDLILVPGVAFDLQGRRVGRGKGFYDQLLSVVRGTTCGVAFDEQIVGEIPVAPHDIHVNCILTPTRWLEP